MQIIRQTYPNGLKSLSVLSKDTQAVTIMFLVKVGSRYEAVSEQGLAHFLEHTLFKGTSERPSSKQIGMEIESLGGSTNAFTSYDYTGYYIKAPAINFKPTFAILADMFRNSIFAEKELERERGVIIEEIRMYEDRPPSKVAQSWLSNFFRENPLAGDIAGTIESVREIKREQFLGFMEKHYYAENVLIVVSGNIEQGSIEEEISKYCLGIPSRGEKLVSQYQQFEFAEHSGRARNIEIIKEVEQTHVVLGGLALPRDHSQRFALQVANAILGAGFGSRLFQVIRDELGLAYYVYSRISSFTDVGIFQIGMGVDAKRVDEAIAATKKELTAVVEGQFTNDEFNRAKNYLLGNIVTELETSEDVASFYGMQEILEKEQLTIDQLREQILAVTLDDVHEVAGQIFKEENYYTAKLSRG